MPAREDDGTSYKAEDLLFLLLVRGSSDRASFDESQDSSSEMRTRRADAVAFDQDISPLGSPMCDVAVPVHYRGFSAFVGRIRVIVVLWRLTYLDPQETALINSGTKKRMDKSHKKDCSHRDRARPSIRPKDVGMGWLRDVYNCGNNHLVGCWCDVWIGVLPLLRKSRWRSSTSLGSGKRGRSTPPASRCFIPDLPRMRCNHRVRFGYSLRGGRIGGGHARAHGVPRLVCSVKFVSHRHL